MSWAPITSSEVPEIATAWVQENLHSDKFQLVDCREPNEWNSGYIETALSCPLSSWAQSSAKISKDKPVVVYCHSGVRSLSATADLLSKGYQVASMTGGISFFNR